MNSKPTIRIDPQVVRLVDRATAEKYLALPIAYHDEKIILAMSDPDDLSAVVFFKNHLSFPIIRARAPKEKILRAIKKLLSERPPTVPPSISTPLGEVLASRRLIKVEQLQRALAMQRITGDRLGSLLVSMGYINRLALSEALAEQYQLPHINLRKERPEAGVVDLMDHTVARRLGCIPVRQDGDGLLVAISDPTDPKIRQEIQTIFAQPIKYAVTSDFDIEWLLRTVYRETFLYESIWGLFYRSPEESAFQTFSTAQIIFFVLSLLGMMLGFLFAARSLLIALNLFISLLYLIVSFYRMWLAYRGASSDIHVLISDEDVRNLDDIDLPIFTILVPVFHEKETLPQLIKSLETLDYPKAKLDVKLLMEEVDVETLDTALKTQPPGFIEFVIVPDSIPRTKPKACNYGLLGARGKYTVIFDVEDIPEPDQLKKVVLAFQRGGDELVCVQAKLNYYNRNQNLLTRWFTSEYSNWFDLVLPGLDYEDLPIPLGGTSNHFITEKLRELGGWDPFNVTEDADLGIRMYKHSYHTVILESTTYEEANSDIWNWVRQRTRWIKGYMQTWLVNMRHPVLLFKELGLKGFLGFHLTVGGTPFLFVINPVFWILTSIWFIFRWETVQLLFPPFIFIISSFNLFVGNFAFVYMNVVSSFRRNYYELCRYALLSPFYWMLMSVAAWRAMWQLITKPFYWEKTIHGLDKINQPLSSVMEKS